MSPTRCILTGIGALAALTFCPIASAQKTMGTNPPPTAPFTQPSPQGGWAGGSDDCFTPQPLVGTGAFNFDTLIATTGAEGQNETLCAQYGAPGIENDVWFEWTAAEDGTAVISTCGTATTDTKVAIYDAGACPLDGSALACNDDVCDTQTAVAWTVVNGQSYLIQLGSYPATMAGTGTFELGLNSVGGVLASYSAGSAGTPPTAPDPTTQSWDEFDTSGGSVSTTDVSPDGGSGLNAWQVDDAGTGGGDKLFYELLVGPEAVAVGRQTGWELSANMRMLSGAAPGIFFEFSTGHGTVHERYHAWFSVSGNDVSVRILGPTGPTYLCSNAMDGNYHTFTLRKPAGQDVIIAEFLYDGNVLGPAPSAGATAANADGGVRWGAGHDTNTGAANWNTVRYEVGSAITGSPFCFGDGSGTACPCGNPGASDSGCANSTGAGAILDATGSNSVGANDLAFSGAHLLPGQPGLLFVGNNAVNGGMGNFFGDGLRCAGQSVVRLGVKVPDTNGDANWGPGLGAQGGWSAGDDRYFQIWYRDPTNSPCGAGFNLSNGFRVSFQP